MFGTPSKFRLAPSSRRRVRPRLDMLEGRALLSTLTVTSPADSGPGTLRAEVIAAASGDTINFAPSLDGQTITLTSVIYESGKSLNIAGPGASKLTVSGNDSTAILDVEQSNAPGSPYLDLTISGLTLAHGNTPYHGGALYTYGTNVTLSGDVFSNNHSASGGGAVEAQGPFGLPTPANAVTITDTQFLNDSTSAVGGAFEGFGVAVNLSGSTVHNNSATIFGGGFVASGANLTVASSDFRDNAGGAISYYPGYTLATVQLSVSDSTFIGNTRPQGRGGAIDNEGGLSTYTNSLFQGNVDSDPNFAQGGAIQDSGKATIDGCTFVGNRADGTGSSSPYGSSATGGAVFLANPAGTTLTNSTFRDNLATAGFASGGAIDVFTFNNFSTAPLNFSGLSFVHNRAVSVASNLTAGSAEGGALEIANVAGAISIADTTFLGNQAIGGDGGTKVGEPGQGGAIGASGGFGVVPNSLTLTNVAFVGNQALGGRGDQGGGIASGGALFGLDFLPTIITGGTFLGNSAIAGGGGNSLAAGGAINSFGRATTLNGTSFIGNLAQGGDGGAGQAGSFALGGAINGQVVSNNATFVGNQAIGGRGGASATPTGTGGRGGDAEGGAINTGNATINGGLFLGNAAIAGRGGSAGKQGTGGAGGDAKGGAIAIDTGTFPGTLTINDATFALNLAIGGDGGSGGTRGADGQGLGGAVYNNGGTVVIKRTRFLLNRASTAGNNVYGPYSS